MLKKHCVQDASPGIPMFVFLSPGVDVAAGVEALGRKRGFTADTGRYGFRVIGFQVFRVWGP